MPLLSKQDFLLDLREQMDRNSDVLYQNYLNAKADGADIHFKESSEPLKTPVWIPEKSGYTMAEIQAAVDQLERDQGYEKLALSVGGALIKIAVAAAGAKLP